MQTRPHPEDNNEIELFVVLVMIEDSSWLRRPLNYETVGSVFSPFVFVWDRSQRGRFILCHFIIMVYTNKVNSGSIILVSVVKSSIEKNKTV